MPDTQLTHKTTSGQTFRPAETTLHADRALIQNVLAGDPRAYREFEARYRSLIYSVLHRCHVGGQDQDDIYQELYVRLWSQDLRRLRLWQSTGMRRFSYYLTTMVHNLVCDWYRDNNATPILIDSVSVVSDKFGFAGVTSLFPGEMPEDCDAALMRSERASVLRKEIGRLRSRDADLIRRKYLSNQSYQEIGEALGLSINTVGVALSNARRRLGKRLCRLNSDLFNQERSSQYTRARKAERQ
jgi:RNA polymerase sigma-70 factor (ECF subfamily)